MRSKRLVAQIFLRMSPCRTRRSLAQKVICCAIFSTKGSALKLTDKQKKILASLFGSDWLRPMDIGGSDGSSHSRILRQLENKGLVESKPSPRSLMAMFGSPRAGRMYCRKSNCGIESRV